MNLICCKGNIVNEPKFSDKGKTNVVRFSIAVKRPYSEETDFFNVVAFSHAADFIKKHFKKGQPILIQGHLINDSYVDKENNKRNVTKIIADLVDFAGFTKNDPRTSNKSSLSDNSFNFTDVIDNDYEELI